MAERPAKDDKQTDREMGIGREGGREREIERERGGGGGGWEERGLLFCDARTTSLRFKAYINNIAMFLVLPEL